MSMRHSTYPRELSADLQDPILDTYHVEGADVPEAMEGKLDRQRTKWPDQVL